MQTIIYQNQDIYIEKEPSEIPWLKIFTNEPYRELGNVPKELRLKLWEVYDVVEHEMKKFYNPAKINMASFGNMLPRVHIHVMARFENDSYFPEPMWGKKQREGSVELQDEELFYKKVVAQLEKLYRTT